MNIAELFKKNFVLVPVIASVLFGTFTGVKYVVNLTDTINANQSEIIDLKRDLKVAEDKIVDMNCFTIESAMNMVVGTARSMGVTVTGEKPH